jgi:hypothetical protein
MSTEVTVKPIPYELQRYIDKRQRAEMDGNQCDHRPTYQDALDRIKETAIEQHASGVQWLATVSEEEKRQCSAYWNWKDQKARDARHYSYVMSSDLTLLRTKDFGWTLVPTYMTMITEVRELAKIFTPVTTP